MMAVQKGMASWHNTWMQTVVHVRSTEWPRA